MDYKIDGKFLKMERLDEWHYKIWWTNANNEPQWRKLDVDHMVLISKGAPQRIEEYRQKLAKEKDQNQRENHESMIRLYTFEALWPQMFVAHNKGLSLNRFFKLPKSSTGKTRKKLWKGTKSEFCQHIRDEYTSNKQHYRSERNATVKIYARFRFSDKKWTMQKCYALLKQL